MLVQVCNALVREPCQSSGGSQGLGVGSGFRGWSQGSGVDSGFSSVWWAGAPCRLVSEDLVIL